MRIRNRSLSNGNVPSTPWTDVFTHTASGAPAGGSSGTASAKSLGSSTEVITDQGTELFGVKPVDHTKVDFLINPEVLKLVYWTSGAYSIHFTNGWISLAEIGYGYPNPTTMSSGFVDLSWQKTTEQLRLECLHSFYDQNKVDTLLNIIESGQSVRSVIQFYRTAKKLHSVTKATGADPEKSWFESLRAMWQSRKRHGKTLFDISRDINGQFLAYSFGWSPLVRDIQRLTDELRKMRTRLREMSNNSYKPYTRTASCGAVINHSSYATGLSGYSPDLAGSNGGWWTMRVLPTQIPKLLVGVRGRRTNEYKTDLFREIDYVVGSLIATGPMSLAWEATRLSFVLDWFVNVTGILDRMDQALIGSNRKIERCWTTESYELILQQVKLVHGIHRFPSLDGQQIARTIVKRYHRESLNPGLSVEGSGRFGKKQAILLSSLAYQLVANLVSKRKR